jgi:hypothetical protein
VKNDDGSDQSLAPISGGSGGSDPARRADPFARVRGEHGFPREQRLEEALPPFVPRGAGEILDLALEVLRDRFALIVGTCVLVWIPVRLLEPFIGAGAWAERESSLGQMTTALLVLSSVGVASFLQILVQALSSAVVARLVFATLHGERPTVGHALGEALRRVPGLVVIAIITALATSIGCCFFFVPFVYLQWKLSLAPTVYVLEDADMGVSLTRSFALTPGSFLRWLAVAVVLFFLAIPFTGVVAGAVQPQLRDYVIESTAMSGGVFDAILVVVSSVFMGFATALASVTMTIFYLDCRVRREGYDLRRSLDAMRADYERARKPAESPA